MMKTKLLMGLLLALTVFLASCGGSDTGNTFSPYLGGNQGLDIDFMAGSPPDEIFDNEQYSFTIGVELKNPGEHDLDTNDGYIEIEGISAAEFGISSSDLRQDIPAMRGTVKNAEGVVLTGDVDVVTFDGLNYQQNLFGNLETRIKAVACYDYRTSASANICLKEETIDITGESSVCNVVGSKSVANSGGPIQITQVMESSRGRDGVQLAFTIAKVGETNDRFFKPGTDCEDKVNNVDRDVVYIDVGALDNGRLNARCSGFRDGNGGSNGYVYLPGGEPRTITCTYDTESVNTDFETRVTVEVEYRYMQFIEKPVLIKDIGDE